jgi:hypothetical protein
MTKQFFPVVFTALAIAFFLIPATTAFGNQQCSAAMPPGSHGYWSWRLIDGRRCWYEGKPMLSRSSLEWPAQAAAPSDQAAAASDSDEKLAIAPVEKPGDPMDAQARATDSETFEALWRARIDPTRKH